MKENSIKNERSSIEEDIKIINNFITYFNKNIQNGNKADLTVLGEEINALEHILSDYKRVLEMNEVLLKENEELKEKIREQTLLISPYYVKENYIPIQKIKDKIEYLDNQQKQWIEDRELKESDSEIIFARNFLQELIEEREEE